ncbi:MAG TPA: hypothetical protein VEK07_05245 [Polyangiaceae bacterium]|nr:hypothetical protein [Polyangiaceae bacterium]
MDSPNATPAIVPPSSAPPVSGDLSPAASPGAQSKSEVPPIALPTRAGAAEEAAPSWFARPPLSVTAGQGARGWKVTLYGFIEADAINDSTRSYVDSIGNALVARNETYEGKVGRTQFSIRNTRLGFALESPVIGGIKPSAIIETDFFGNQPSGVSEAAYFDSPGLRLRQAYFKLANEVVDVWAGQTYDLFGWQNYFFPCSLEFLGLPNELFDRRLQVRLAHTFESDAVNIDVAIAALRPAQADSELPDANAGIRFSANGWKGITTPGNGGTTALPLSIGVSGVMREFKVNAFTPPPPQTSNSATGWGVSIDALVPVIPARNSDDRGNRLTLTGSFVLGTGIADLVDAGGGAQFPVLPNPALANPPPVYTPDIDNGLVTFDTSGVLHTIDWQTFMAGIQYYVPPMGRVILSANYTEGYSKNMASLYPQGGAEIGLLTKVAKLLRYADANVLWDVTPAVRVGASFQYTTTEYIDGETPRNFRYMAQGLYFF